MARATTPRISRFRLHLLDLEARNVPAFLAGAEVAVGADAGSPPIVRLLDPASQNETDSLLAFDPTFYGGVRVAVGDVNGDGTPDLVCAAGPGGGPAVKVFDGKTGAATAFFAFDPSFTGGVNIAVGDVDGDGKGEIIAGAGAAGGPEVTVFDGAGHALRSFFAYEPDVRSGVRVAAGDVTGDGKADIVTGPGYGGGPDVRVFDLSTSATGPVHARDGFFAYDPSFIGGVYVGTADLNGDGKAEIVTGAGAGGGPVVGVFDGSGGRINAFFAYDPTFRGGVRIGAAQLTDGPGADIITAPGAGGGSQVNVYAGAGSALLSSQFAFPTGQVTGSFVAGSATRLTAPFTLLTAYLDGYAPLQQASQSGHPLLTPADDRVAGGHTTHGPSYYEGVGLYAPLGTVFAASFFQNPGYYGSPTYLSVPGGGYTFSYLSGSYAPGAYPLIPVPLPPATNPGGIDNTPNPPTGNVDSSNGDALGSNSNDSAYVPGSDANFTSVSYTPSSDTTIDTGSDPGTSPGSDTGYSPGGDDFDTGGTDCGCESFFDED
ncbi:FG-GAP repeat domain-containing protein [Limnoglobus roseus]|uniref:VCBS repeat-containing protein n=1 Tax=Limnoglobus roseus TaxID=2598579 RepID=A0A5C1ANB7_9BACT|nr:VCBS repeat-containing protein [Limnoglobus roseus]QEL19486.1 hypothetical protein PX52LOC_06559 [Limnoglobus roseus]